MDKHFGILSWQQGRRRRQWLRIAFVFVYAFSPGSDIFVHSCESPHNEYRFSADLAARAMNTVDFLRELVNLKCTSDETYYCHLMQHEHNTKSETELHLTNPKTTLSLGIDPPWNRPPESLPSTGAVQEAKSDSGQENGSATVINPLSYSTTCEYTGNLWFLPRNSGIRFRETVRVCHLSPRSSRVQCDTQYCKNGRWVECCSVVCNFSSDLNPPSTEGIALGMIIRSTLLVRIPLPGVAGRVVQKKIASSFKSAAVRLLQRNLSGYNIAVLS